MRSISLQTLLLFPTPYVCKCLVVSLLHSFSSTFTPLHEVLSLERLENVQLSMFSGCCSLSYGVLWKLEINWKVFWISSYPVVGFVNFRFFQEPLGILRELLMRFLYGLKTILGCYLSWIIYSTHLYLFLVHKVTYCGLSICIDCISYISQSQIDFFKMDAKT